MAERDGVAEQDGDSPNGRLGRDAEDGYAAFSRDQLVNQIKLLKAQLEQQNNAKHMRGKSIKQTALKTSKRRKDLDFDRYPKRKIAMMISYHGAEHGGLAWQPEITPQTTVEGELFRALLVARLVEGSESAPEGVSQVDFEDEQQRWRALVDVAKWGYSRAGRTDAGVSGCGQVVSLWVRSRLKSAPDRFGFRPPINPSACAPDVSQTTTTATATEGCKEEETAEGEEELGYHTMLNSILPESVRVLAWSPVHEAFDARFSCTARHYKYFFSLYESPSAPALDIAAMRDAAARLVGEHDFRNFCRIDPSKQLAHFRRRILSAEINLVDVDDQGQPWPSSPAQEEAHRRTGQPVYPEALSPNTNRLFVLDLVGTAFLYNMVRHIVAVLFLVGSGHERPDVVDRLVYTDGDMPVPASLAAGGLSPEPVACKPEYSHASALPLLLYRCVYPDDSFCWTPTPVGSARPPSAEPFVAWSRARIQAQLAFHLIAVPPPLFPPPQTRPPPLGPTRYISPLGAASARAAAEYVPLIDRPRAPHFSVVNANWWNKVGARRVGKRQLL
jgi:tRNA pseudouridine38/39 synthase